jgi:hypothetical protein
MALNSSNSNVIHLRDGRHVAEADRNAISAVFYVKAKFMSKSKNVFTSARSLAAAICAALAFGVVIDAGALDRHEICVGRGSASLGRRARRRFCCLRCPKREIFLEAQAIVRDKLKPLCCAQARRAEHAAWHCVCNARCRHSAAL